MKSLNFLPISIKVSFAFLLAFNLSSCDKCEDIDCFSPPEAFCFQLIDKETNQNLLQNGTYSFSDIQIKSISEEKFHTLQIDSVEIEEQKQVVLIDNEIGWETENKDYILILNDSLEFNFIYQTKKKSEDCCAFYETEEVSFSELKVEIPTPNNGFFYKLAL
ncbi:hypothetical protein Fleli_3691 [Bernardetia litoralis DSM 6794]|uniref:Uncharacterized protein n=1 Tax=Bernardetia litoralis (strain ATCC 23117 / DSM 6794 / NBRC 15988 / NCIMB 1366 / Fx l1 / Sio-4) TaxID=880071 RepID=I4APX0_BERLS|nr:hypothetical protein [Bernardetia litoralis]AFM06005.1 hypothetical protein Fleli_3691 [Bernardetia litoralis DSM 6794]